jgi:phage FluMu protein Com
MHETEPEKNLIEIRCKFCHRMFFKATAKTEGELRVKCSKCKTMNIIRLPFGKKENKISTVAHPVAT